MKNLPTAKFVMNVMTNLKRVKMRVTRTTMKLKMQLNIGHNWRSPFDSDFSFTFNVVFAKQCNL